MIFAIHPSLRHINTEESSLSTSHHRYDNVNNNSSPSKRVSLPQSKIMHDSRIKKQYKTKNYEGETSISKEDQTDNKQTL